MEGNLLDVLLDSPFNLGVERILLLERDLDIFGIQILEIPLVVVPDQQQSPHGKVSLSHYLLIFSLKQLPVRCLDGLKYSQEAHYKFIMAVVAVVFGPIDLANEVDPLLLFLESMERLPLVLVLSLVYLED